MPEQFISEPIQPVDETISAESMATGEPGFPMAFHWREKRYAVATILEKWKSSSPCRSGANEQYVRKHWFRIQTSDGLEMKIYFERQPQSKRQAKSRWWLYTIKDMRTERAKTPLPPFK